jgi:hypothetical protein
MKRITVLAAALIILVFMIHGYVLGAKAVLKSKEGDIFPEIQLPYPKKKADQKYLGLTGEGFFRLQDIKAEAVIIQIFAWS